MSIVVYIYIIRCTYAFLLPHDFEPLSLPAVKNQPEPVAIPPLFRCGTCLAPRRAGTLCGTWYNIVNQNIIAIFLERSCRWLLCPMRAPHRIQYANQNNPVLRSRRKIASIQLLQQFGSIAPCLPMMRKDRRSRLINDDTPSQQLVWHISAAKQSRPQRK